MNHKPAQGTIPEEGKFDLEMVHDSTVRHISSSRKEVTMLFTDMKDSTSLWEAMGDVAGRMMIDQHNKLLFPVIRKFRGKVVKTIGDAIMARFKKPGNAVKAAIVMQQVLDKQRLQDPDFKVHIRIGVHTGRAVVEKGDVYGDVVNVAARVESQAPSDHILVSGVTAEKLEKSEYKLTESGSFTPKGKRQKIIVFTSDWKKYKDLTHLVKVNLALTAMRSHAWEFTLYVVTALALVGIIFFKYIRFIVADNESMALSMLNPQRIPTEHPWIFGIVVIISSVLLIYLLRLSITHITWLKFFRGTFLFAIVFMLLQTVLPLSSDYLPKKFQSNLYISKHLFVEVITDGAFLRVAPNLRSDILQELNIGTLLLLNSVKKRNTLTWNKVLVSNDSYGWIVRKTPAKIGVPEKIITSTRKFYFSMIDAVSLSIAALAFIIGFLRFRVRPV
jgi:class 3 adenylate cyclase